MKKAVFGLVAGVIALAGCTTTVPLKTEFDRAYAKEQVQPGPNIIKGSALIRQQAGGVVTCAGLPVFLVPQSSYAMERTRAIYGNTNKGYRPVDAPAVKFTPDEPDFMQYTKKTMCNAQGFFEFPDVADGDWFVSTGIVWTVGYAKQGGALMEGVSVSGGDVVDVVLSP